MDLSTVKLSNNEIEHLHLERIFVVASCFDYSICIFWIHIKLTQAHTLSPQRIVLNISRQELKISLELIFIF